MAVTNSGLFTKSGTGTIVAPGGFSTTGNVSLPPDVSGSIFAVGSTNARGSSSTTLFPTLTKYMLPVASTAIPPGLFNPDDNSVVTAPFTADHFLMELFCESAI